MSAPYRIDLTAAWEPPGPGQVDWSRSFGRPGGLAVADRVWLVVGGTRMFAPELNGTPLPPRGDGRWDVTQLLRGRNRLVLKGSGAGTVDTSRGRETLPMVIGTAWLEIDAAD